MGALRSPLPSAGHTGVTRRVDHGRAAYAADRIERESVQRGGPVLAQQPEMLRRSIPLMSRKIVLRIGEVVLGHEAVSRHFGHHRRGSDLDGEEITFDDGTLRTVTLPEPDGIQQQEIRDDGQGPKRPPHREPRRLEDIQPVDFA